MSETDPTFEPSAQEREIVERRLADWGEDQELFSHTESDRSANSVDLTFEPSDSDRADYEQKLEEYREKLRAVPE